MKARLLLLSLILAGVLGWPAAPTGALPPSEPVAPAVTSRPAGRWELVYEEAGVGIGEPGERTLVADAAGNLHAVYGGAGLFYARRINGMWQDEMVVSGLLTGWGASLALDPTGAPHICYRSERSWRHAWRDGQGWHTEHVAADTDWTWPSSIAAGPGNAVAMGFRSDNDLVVATRDPGGTWRTERVATNTQPNTISLLLDAQGWPEVAHSGTGLYFHYKDAEGWHGEKLADAATSASLAAAGDWLRLAYTTGDAALLLTNTPNGWQSETIATGEELRDVSLTLDGVGIPHVGFYHGYSPRRLFYSVRMADGWHTTDTGNRPQWSPQQVTVALMGSVPALAECQACPGYEFGWQSAALALTLLQPDGPARETIGRTRLVGAIQKVSVESDGKVHLVYGDGRGHEPVHAWEDAAGWHREVVAGARSTDAAAVDSAGRLHMAFIAGDGVRYALRDGSGWHTELVQAGFGEHPTLTLDREEQPHVAWLASAAIRIASRNGEAWTTQAVAGGETGLPALGWDGSGRPHVAYIHGTRVRYAYADNSTWYHAFPAPLVAVWDHPSLAISWAGASYLGYAARCNNEDHYCRLEVNIRTGREWHNELLTECNGAPCAVSLALDAEDGLSAAYVAGWPMKLYYAQRVAGAWQSEPVPSDLMEPAYPPDPAVSIGLDGAARPTISYYSAEILGVRILRWTDSPSTDATPRAGS